MKKKFRNHKTKILNDFDKINTFKKSEFTISAIPGIAGLDPTIKMIKFTNKMLIANKESIICGWNLIKTKAKKTNTQIIPIDRTFFYFNLLYHHKIEEINKVYLTASEGPFLNYKSAQLKVQPMML